ncbi:MAG: cytochrome P450, partial [Planctomycetes bacterium]|nr:cytochrome P450 [Planctomycetota bacterium]
MQSTIDFDLHLLSPEYLADPYPYYHALRESEPVAWSERLNAWVLTRYADVLDALRHQKLISGQRVKAYADMLPPATRNEMRPLFDHVGLWIGNLDPPDHTRLRRLVNVVFTPRMVEGLRPDIEQTITELLDELMDRSSFDFVQDFAYPLPAIVISQMLGVPRADRERFMSWSDDLTAYAGTGKPDLEVARVACTSAAALGDYLQH